MTFPVNLTLNLLLFRNVLLSRGVNSPRLFCQQRWRRGEWPFL